MMKKNKIIECRLIITKLQPLGLAFFNSITKFLTILYSESSSTTFYLLFFPLYCTIPNDLKYFKHLANLLWRMNPKKHHHLEHFIMQMWACKVQLLDFLQGPKEHFCKFKSSYLAIQIVEIFLKFSTYSQLSILQDPMVTCVQKIFFFPNFGNCIWNGNSRVFFIKT